MDYQEVIEYFDKELKRECMVLSPILEGKKSVRAQFFEMAISAMQELQDIKANMDENLHIQISELRQAKFDIETFWEESTTLSKAMQNAVRALVEIQQYKQLGTLEEVREAVERLQPKAPNWHMNPVMEHGKLPVCPTCNTIMVRTEILGRTIDEHCVTCGQAIDWSVSE